jgi:hypothetical protein
VVGPQDQAVKTQKETSRFGFRNILSFDACLQLGELFFEVVASFVSAFQPAL